MATSYLHEASAYPDFRVNVVEILQSFNDFIEILSKKYPS